uniref:RNase H type-1 domain-containing protein n=1 Tax=Nelumbo nucifera TaxID=4432 RepID=A0A822XG90_NELNU|nr:TPA_asm: hypothetical protein HUJ06_019318 [Nelumbo nucifera]
MKTLLPRWKNTLQAQARPTKQSFWQAPPENNVKVNVDGSFKVPGIAGFGIAVKNHCGYILAISFCPASSSSPLQAEALACLKGIQLVHRLFTGSFILESDSLTLVQALKSRIWHQ